MMRQNFEVERRFLVLDPAIVDGHSGNILVQAYLFSADGYVVRVRRTHLPTGESGEFDECPSFLAAKGPRESAMRQEYELEIPSQFASEFIRRAPWRLSKTRYQIIRDEQAWDVDLFHGDNEGLIIAENEGYRSIDLKKPTWCSSEITGDRRYDNENLARTPYSTWPEAKKY